MKAPLFRLLIILTILAFTFVIATLQKTFGRLLSRQGKLA